MCNCGEQFGQYRDHCVHLGSLISYIIKKYIENYCKTNDVSELNYILNKFKDCLTFD